MLHDIAGTVRAVRRRRRGPRAFTLLETMMALVIIGVGILAYVEAQTSFIKTNGWSSQAGTAMLLANEIREMTRRLPRHDPVTGLFVDNSSGSPVLVGWGREAGEATAADLDDIDDLDGLQFGNGGTLPGPIDAYGNVVPEVDINGVVETNAGNPVPLEGWSQRVIVEKVDPYNYSTVRAAGYSQAATSSLPAIPVNGFPLRVTVVVEYQSVDDVSPQEIARVTWVRP